jgi:hypothetical protein
MFKVNGGIREQENIQGVFRNFFLFRFSHGLPAAEPLLQESKGGIIWGLEIILNCYVYF